MRVFKDACIDPRMVEAFPQHQVQTAFDLGWHTFKDHVLVPLVAAQFDVLVTSDRRFEHQHNLQTISLGLVIVHVRKNKVEFYRPLYSKLDEAVRMVRPGAVIHVAED